MLEVSTEATLPHHLARWAARKPTEIAHLVRAPSGHIETTCWRDFHMKARLIAKGLIALGHAPNEAVAILATNRPAWSWCQLGIGLARGTVVPIYPSSTEEQAEYIVRHSEARIAFSDSAEGVQRLRAAQGTRLEHVISLLYAKDSTSPTMTLYALMALGAQAHDDPLDTRFRELSQDDMALLIYTSGTTGVPKGVELTHRNMVLMGRSLVEDYAGLLEDMDLRALSYLPLSHIAEQLFTTVLHLTLSGQVYFCPDLGQLREHLTWSRPTVFVGVPRVWEKLEASLRARLRSAPPAKAALARWAMATELAAQIRDARTGRARHTLSRRAADRWVISRIKQALGFDRLVLAGCGAAPVGVDTLRFFASLGISIHEAYGMTETAGVLTAPAPRRPIFGTVGRPVPGVRIRIAEDGEICAQGATMTAGYHKEPEATSDLIDADGWLHTGDLGEIGESGYLRITGRKKDIIITAGGKNIAPTELENHLRGIPGIGCAVVVGDRRPYLTALLSIDADEAKELASAMGLPSSDPRDLAASAEVREFVRLQIEERCNRRVARYQTIKRFALVAAPFTVESGLITPSLKVRRARVHEIFSDQIEAMYSSGSGGD